MKNKKIISLVIVALIGALVITALIINKTKLKKGNIASINENVNEIQSTNEIKDTTENISDVTNNIQEKVVVESNQDKALQTETKTKDQEIEKVTSVAENKSVEKSSNKGTTTTKTQSKQNAQVKKQEDAKASNSMIVSKSETPKNTNENTNNAPKCNHSNGKWYNSKAEAEAIYNAELKKWGDKWTNYEIDTDTYNKNCPDGYEVFSCPYCNKWTINLYY